MRQPAQRPALSRRAFLRVGAAAVSVLPVAAVRAANRDQQPNPYAYDISALQKVDPKLIQFREVGRLKGPQRDARRLGWVGPEKLGVAAGETISLFHLTGAPAEPISVGQPVRCFATGADGTCFVSVRDHLEVFDAKGQRLAVWAVPAKRTWFTGLAVNETDIFAADSGNRVILRYDRTGNVTGRIGERDQERGIPGFVLPSPYLDVRWHGDGLLRANNPGRHRIEVYTPAGDLELAWGKASMGIQGFCGCCNPVAFALLSDGRYVTCEKALPRVKIYSAKGEFECVVAGPEQFPENAKVGAGETASDGARSSLDVVVDARGRVYVLDTVTGQIHIFERKV